jgi:L-histidine N-alpha-methyltransferase
MSALAPHPITIDHALDAAARTLAEDALDGLTAPLKQVAPKYFYDGRGAALFDEICELPEYYPTRTERAILEAQADRIVASSHVGELVELGSGSATKTRLLLDAMHRAGLLRRYIPVDVHEASVRASAEQLISEYERLSIHGLIGDFERHLDRLPSPSARRLVAFLGGTIGNFRPGSRRRFLRTIAELLRPEDRLLLGTDLVKDRGTLIRAYDDAAGVTAEFNLNMLRVLNRELGADFDPGAFEHVVLYDERNDWIEMRLRAKRPQAVTVRAIDLSVDFAAGEDLLTEISAKFTRERLEADLAAAGLELTDWFTDERGWFALSLARLAG